MGERIIDIVEMPDHPGFPRWQAVAPDGIVAGVAGLRPITPVGGEPDAAELTLTVEPEWRRRGIGSLLLAKARSELEATGSPSMLSPSMLSPSTLIAEVTADSPGEAFCLRHGFTHARSRQRHMLTCCDLHQAWLGELVDVEHPGYRLIHWTGDLPVPHSVEELLRMPSGPGNALLTAADADGDLAAYAVAIVGALTEPRAQQYGPAVLSGHHGRRLGLWVNAALLQHLRELHPHVQEVEAVAGEDDVRLLAVREHLGFQPLRRTRIYELALR
ncbi:MAG: GNAT family N-acetyltransferase [Hamadaea sp.]|nr:GNAT family N-acetyltransferase [Hamadaea sp.]